MGVYRGVILVGEIADALTGTSGPATGGTEAQYGQSRLYDQTRVAQLAMEKLARQLHWLIRPQCEANSSRTILRNNSGVRDPLFEPMYALSASLTNVW